MVSISLHLCCVFGSGGGGCWVSGSGGKISSLSIWRQELHINCFRWFENNKFLFIFGVGGTLTYNISGTMELSSMFI